MEFSLHAVLISCTANTSFIIYQCKIMIYGHYIGIRMFSIKRNDPAMALKSF